MSDLNEKVSLWAQNELNIKVNTNDIISLLQSKNSAVYQKLFSFLTKHLKSRSNAKIIKTAVDYQKLNVKLQELHQEIDQLKEEIRILSLSHERDDHESEVKKWDYKNRKQREHFLNTLVDILEGISVFRCNTSFSRASHGFNYGAVRQTSLKDILCCDVKNDSSVPEVYSSKQVECSRLSEQTNEMVKTINGILFEISSIELPTFENVNCDQLLHLLINHSCNEKIENEAGFGEHFHADGVNKMVADVNNILAVYKQQRSSQIQNRIEKVSQALAMCEKALQMRLKC